MKTLAESLSKSDFLFGQDLDIAYRVITTLLDYELKQTGLNLTSEQDGKYVQVGFKNWVFILNSHQL